MSALDQAEKIVLNLTRSEKIQLLHHLVHELADTFPGIDTRPDVSGGEACIVRTRIPVWLLEQARRLGTGDAGLLRSYPSLRVSDLANAWEYVRTHPEEIDRQILENEAA
jgi:uncharacterized protein (DUF433 family)